MTMFVCSMDHSPTEQLVGSNRWHTTTLILSVAGNQWDTAGLIAKASRRQGGRLTKWSACRPRQKATFAKVLAACLPETPIYVASISAREEEIVYSFDHMVRELHLSELTRAEERNGKSYLRFGPFVRSGPSGEPGEEVYFSLIRTRAIPLIFIVHFMLRMHQGLLLSLRRSEPEVTWMDWQVSADKFPGDVSGGMAKLFYALLGLLPQQGLVSGNLRDLTFLTSDPGSDLADNIAGMLQDQLSGGSPLSSAAAATTDLGALAPGRHYWEVWYPS